jgi:hypothetical protein
MRLYFVFRGLKNVEKDGRPNTLKYLCRFSDFSFNFKK